MNQLYVYFRWILLCFKREFNEKDALRIWEACWSHYQTDYFHLFICVAIVGIYGEDVVEQCLPADEILLHFSSLACHMSGQLVLRKVETHAVLPALLLAVLSTLCHYCFGYFCAPEHCVLMMSFNDPIVSVNVACIIIFPLNNMPS